MDSKPHFKIPNYASYLLHLYENHHILGLKAYIATLMALSNIGNPNIPTRKGPHFADNSHRILHKHVCTTDKHHIGLDCICLTTTHVLKDILAVFHK